MKNGKVTQEDILNISPGSTVSFTCSSLNALSARSLAYQTLLRHPNKDIERYSIVMEKDNMGKTIVDEHGNVTIRITAVAK